MNTIINFLQNKSEDDDFPKSFINKDKLKESFNYIKNNLISTNINAKDINIYQLKNTPRIEKNQIWLCKQEYYDALGNYIIGEFPHLVLIASDIDFLEEKEFVRIQPISPFVEFRADDDIWIEDESILGFNFIIEIWNEQPILTELLLDYVNAIDIENKIETENEVLLTSEQKEFRKIEIQNTAYLRQSVLSYLKFKELSGNQPVIINIKNNIYTVDNKTESNNLEQTVKEPSFVYLQAAKKGINKKRKVYLFEKEIDDINLQIKIIKDKEKYILTIEQPDNVILKDSKKNIIKPESKKLYTELTSGLYFIEINGTDNEFRMKLA